MIERTRKRLTYANVAATLALFVALGGTSVAATARFNGAQIAKGSIPGDRLRKHTITATALNLKKLGKVMQAATADTAARATSADDSARLGGRLPSAFLSSSGTAANSAALGGKAPATFTTAGASSVNGNHYGLGSLGDLVTLDVAVGPTARHVLIVGNTEVWSYNGACNGYVALSWQGTDRVAETAVAATAPAASLANTYASLTTTAMPLLPAGTQTVKLRGLTTGACVGFENRRLSAVVLDN